MPIDMPVVLPDDEVAPRTNGELVVEGVGTAPQRLCEQGLDGVVATVDDG